MNLKGGVLSVDDSVLDKPYSHKMAFVGYFWSGKHHATVKGINLITLYYSDIDGRHQPVNYRIVDKSEGKTKNEHFREMLAEVLTRGLEPAYVTWDSWYSGITNLKKVRNHHLGFLFALESTTVLYPSKKGHGHKFRAPQQNYSCTKPLQPCNLFALVIVVPYLMTVVPLKMALGVCPT